MTAIETVLREPAAQAIGWALLHFAWQGALIGIVAAIALRLLRGSAADVRYVVSAIALSLMATMPVVTGWQTYRATSVSSSSLTGGGAPIDVPADPNTGPLTAARAETKSATPGNVATPEPGSLRTLDSVPARVEPWLPMLVAGWLAGVLLLTLRLLGGWMWVQRLKGHGATSASRELQGMVVRLSKRLHISRSVRLLQSSAVVVPTVIGWLRPVILLPVSALAGLSTTQIEAILAHELAHIRRHDYLVNLLQTLLETLLFYHPAVWWLSGRIRDER
jgi:beta-lactamase regulating signal transducer with metallopeptidase domain